MNKVSRKKNLSSMQVIKTLLTLLKNDYGMQELIYELNKNEPFPVFNNSVVSKYINTCRYIGIEIPKINNVYYVAKLPFGLDLSSFDIDMLNTLQTIVKNDMTARNFKLFEKFYNKLKRFSNKEIAKVEKTEFNFSFELFERAVSKKRKIKLIFKNRTVLECIPLKITEVNGKTFFNVYKKRIRMIDTSRLSGVELLGDRFVDPMEGDLVTIFKLRGDLAKRYEPRENESAVLDSEGFLIVTNKNENKEVLLHRLMRYQNLCEIIHPKAYKEEFKQMLDDTLKNYGII